jgi:hypothetical protein
LVGDKNRNKNITFASSILTALLQSTHSLPVWKEHHHGGCIEEER